MLRSYMNKNFVIREFRSEDEEQVKDLIVGIQTQEFSISITAENQPDLSQIPSFYQTNHGNFWVAVHNQKVIGTVALLDIGNQQVALRKMFVAKDFRGKDVGVAQRLLDQVFHWSQEKGVIEIYLGTT